MEHNPKPVTGHKPRRPYAPPSIIAADELQFETRLACTQNKAFLCIPAGGCTQVTAS